MQTLVRHLSNKQSKENFTLLIEAQLYDKPVVIRAFKRHLDEIIEDVTYNAINEQARGSDTK